MNALANPVNPIYFTPYPKENEGDNISCREKDGECE
jgi:hypothetical protein